MFVVKHTVMTHTNKLMKLLLLCGVVMTLLSSCSASTTDCECTQGSGVSVDFYDQEVSCSDLEDSADMHCTAM